MSQTDFLIDTNILIYHIQGAERTIDFISGLVSRNSFNISVLTKIEFLGWDKHSDEGYEKCRKLLEPAHVYSVDQDIAEKAIELKKRKKIKLADAVIAATALLNNLKLATRNVEDFKGIEGLETENPFA